jgi:predicted GTPase
VSKPSVRVRYELADMKGPSLGEQIDRFLKTI